MNKLMWAEWIKFRTLRFNWGLIAFGVFVNVALLVIQLVFFDRALGEGAVTDTGADARISTVLGPLTVLSSIVGVIAVMIMSSEYKSKTVIPSFAAAPIRSEVIVAKAAIAASMGFLVTLVGLAINLGVGLPVLDAKGFPIEIGDDHFVQAAGGALLYGILIALFGLALGVMLKNSVLSITLIVAIPMVVEPALSGFLPDWVSRYLPFLAGTALVTPGGSEELTAWEGGGVLGMWAVALLILAGVLFERRDLGNTS